MAVRLQFNVQDPLSSWITTEKAVLSKVIHWVRVTAVLPGQSMAKMWQEGNGLFLLENMMFSLKPKPLKVTRTPDSSSIPMLQAEYFWI